MQEQLNQYGPYRHRAHQLAGVWTCVKHEHPLSECTLKSTGVQRFGWSLPHSSYLQPPSDSPPKVTLTLLKRIAHSAEGIVSLEPSWSFNLPIIAHALRTRLIDRGLATASFRLRKEEMGLAFYSFARPLINIPEFLNIAPDRVTASTQICGYFYRCDRIRHPLRHLLAITWLYEGWQDFLTDYLRHSGFTDNNQSMPVENSPSSAQTQRENPALRNSCTRMHEDQGMTASAIAKTLGVSVGTVISHLAAVGISTPRRPKKLRDHKLKVLKQALQEGMSKKNASTLVGVSEVTVTKFLLSEAGLHQVWVQKRSDARRREAHEAWSSLLEGNNTASVQILRALDPATYSWLYRNDRDWLRNANKARLAAPRSVGRKVDWHARDQQLSALVRQAIDTWLSHSPYRRMRIGEVVALFPSLKPFVNKLDKLPSTRSLVYGWIGGSNVNHATIFDLL